MTETEWINNTYPRSLLYQLPRKASQRKRRLLACACCRRIWQQLVDPRSKFAIEVSESFADGLSSREELLAAYGEARKADAHLNQIMARASRPEMEPHWKRWKGAVAAKHASAPKGTAEAISHAPDAIWEGLDHRRREHESQADLVRDVFGNPFRPVALDPRWRTADVLDLARAIYEDRAFDRMPILADALMDAGCDSDDIIQHCRGPGPHVRGCWVVDLILGKE